MSDNPFDKLFGILSNTTDYANRQVIVNIALNLAICSINSKAWANKKSTTPKEAVEVFKDTMKLLSKK